jgi:chloramphenicol 3-O-phosphotransferase
VADVLILSGPPAAGKSTVAQALAERYDRVAHIDVDTLRHFVTPTGYIAPDRPGWERQQALATRNAAALARNFLEERFAVIIDDVVVTAEHLAQYVEALKPAGAPVHFVRLLPRLEVCLARNAAREPGLRPSPKRIETVYRAFEAATDLPGATIDSSELSAYETADHLQALTTGGESVVGGPAGP